MSKHTTCQAVEAAAEKIFQSTMGELWAAASPEQAAECRTIAKEAIEAAAPHIIAEWEDRRERQASEAFQALAGMSRGTK